ncbi:hypothetical protein ABZX39_07915 [Streptomyces collinus]|uniref:hypothetical protein n=1 Tax=Streptomyces collinus TaxID=42684 RepID=UPI0033AADBD2
MGEQFVAGPAVVAVLETGQRGQQRGVGEEVGGHVASKHTTIVRKDFRAIAAVVREVAETARHGVG